MGNIIHGWDLLKQCVLLKAFLLSGIRDCSHLEFFDLTRNTVEVKPENGVCFFA